MRLEHSHTARQSVQIAKTTRHIVVKTRDIDVLTHLLASGTRNPICVMRFHAPATRHLVDLMRGPVGVRVHIVEATHHIAIVTFHITVMTHRPIEATRQDDRSMLHTVDNSPRDADLTLHLCRMTRDSRLGKPQR
jgi:hypothetical protein